MAKRERKPVHHVEMAEGNRAIIQGLLQEMEVWISMCLPKKSPFQLLSPTAASFMQPECSFNT